MKVYAFLPAKGASERVENKNMRFLSGERLFIRALKILLKCKEIDRVFLDTESEELYRMADYLPIQFMKRNPSLATNNTDGHQMLVNEVKSYPDADIYVQLLCTSPFINPSTIDDAILKLKADMSYDSAILMKKEKCYFWDNGKPCYNIDHVPNSRTLPDTITESMGLYIIRKEAALKYNRRYGAFPLLLFGKNEELVDVNTPEDLDFAEVYATGLRRKENERLRLIKHFISSPALSDLLDDLENETGKIYGAVINGWKTNMQGRRLFGRANTLRLRSLAEGEDFKGIYRALDSYEGISENDIIVVENEEKDFAYFGDLNARLAIRSGASGAIIDGATRDMEATRHLSFPIYAKSYNAVDVRRRATVDYINKPVSIAGQKIHPHDLIFIDECAMVVIYQENEQIVIDSVLEKFKNEKSIITDIVDRKDVEDIISERGEF